MQVATQASENLYLNKCTIIQIEFDPAKRLETLFHRGLDFVDCQQAFAGVSYTFEDARKSYGETRFITWALMQERLVVIVWTQREEARRIISLGKANERETKIFHQALDRHG